MKNGKLSEGEVLAALSIRHQGEWAKIYEDIKNKIAPTDGELDAIEGLKYVSLLDQEYPQDLKDCGDKPPFVLFYEGNLDLLKRKKICVLPQEHQVPVEMGILLGLYQNEEIAFVVEGRNEVLLHAASDDIGDTLALTEVPPNARDETTNRMARDCEIMAGISNCLIIVGSNAERNGEVSCYANAFLRYGKDIYVTPQELSMGKQSLNNQLIKEGAKVLTCVEDIAF